MRARLLLRGRSFSIYAADMGTSDKVSDCQAENFLNDLRTSDHASYKSLMNILRLCAEQGPIRNLQKSRHLEDGIFEFKSQQADRLYYFYPGEPNKIVITHGAPKPKDKLVPVEIRKAKQIRLQYETK